MGSPALLRCFMATRRPLRRREGYESRSEIVWEKQNGSSFHADASKRVHEPAVQFYPTETPWREHHNDAETTPDATARTARRKQRPPHTGQDLMPATISAMTAAQGSCAPSSTCASASWSR